MPITPYWGRYNVDIIMCIDATASMQPILDEVKRSAFAFYDSLLDVMEEENKSVDTMRVKVIAFRDYKYDDEPMVESEFFVLPDQREELKAFLDKIEAAGGGDTPECAFEAISLALKSDWTTEGRRRRHIIAVFTDAPALPLQERADCPNYPRDIPKSLSEFAAWWEETSWDWEPKGYSRDTGILIAFVPNDKTWIQLESLDRYVPVYNNGIGIDEVDMNYVIASIVGS